MTRRALPIHSRSPCSRVVPLIHSSHHACRIARNDSSVAHSVSLVTASTRTTKQPHCYAVRFVGAVVVAVREKAMLYVDLCRCGMCEDSEGGAVTPKAAAGP